MKAIVDSGGAFISVTDEEILDSIRTLARKAAVFGEPAGVAGVAGVRNAVKQGVIAANETVALLITGNGLKDIQSAIKAAGAPTYIEPELAAVKVALAGGSK